MASETENNTFHTDFKKCLNHLLTLDPEARNDGLQNYLKNESQHFQDAIYKASVKERYHIRFVRESMEHLGFPDSIHDWSKDAYYFFITNGKFHFMIKSDELEKEFLRVVRVHYSLEPHHPEWEQIHNKSCTPEDVIEMAVDRCCRNAWANDGDISMEQMNRYLPKFTFDHEQKLEDYLENVEKVKGAVQEEYAKIMQELNEKPS